MSEAVSASSTARPMRKLLAANRSEIAIRIFRSAHELGIRTVAMYSHEDRFALHRFKADEAYRVGKTGEPIRAYLDIGGIIELARQHEIDAETLATDAVTDPLDVGCDLIRRMHRFAEYRKTTGIDHCDGDVLAVGECDDRIFDVEPVTEFGMQGIAHDGCPTG